VYGAHPGPGPDEGNPLLAGLITGILVAVLWVLVVSVTHNGVGLAAWGAGGLVGIAVAKSARPPSVSTGTLAGVLTLGTTLAAKAALLAFALGPIARDEILRDREATAAMFALDMTKHHAFSPALQAALDSQVPEGEDTALSGLRGDLPFRMLGEARTRARAASRAERERVVRVYADSLVLRAGFWSLLGRLFGPWDMLWLGLGVSTAWKLGQGIA
jgi:hypothetical protein